MSLWIGISLGDVTGIGPEVALKALEAERGADDARYLLIGDEEQLRALNQRLGLQVNAAPALPQSIVCEIKLAASELDRFAHHIGG